MYVAQDPMYTTTLDPLNKEGYYVVKWLVIWFDILYRHGVKYIKDDSNYVL